MPCGSRPGWIDVAMSHGAGDAAMMRELDWVSRHMCLFTICVIYIDIYAHIYIYLGV